MAAGRVLTERGPVGVTKACAWASLASPIQAPKVITIAATALFTRRPPAVFIVLPRRGGVSQGPIHEILKAVNRPLGPFGTLLRRFQGTRRGPCFKGRQGPLRNLLERIWEPFKPLGRPFG